MRAIQRSTTHHLSKDHDRLTSWQTYLRRVAYHISTALGVCKKEVSWTPISTCMMNAGLISTMKLLNKGRWSSLRAIPILNGS